MKKGCSYPAGHIGRESDQATPSHFVNGVGHLGVHCNRICSICPVAMKKLSGRHASHYDQRRDIGLRVVVHLGIKSNTVPATDQHGVQVVQRRPGVLIPKDSLSPDSVPNLALSEGHSSHVPLNATPLKRHIDRITDIESGRKKDSQQASTLRRGRRVAGGKPDDPAAEGCGHIQEEP